MSEMFRFDAFGRMIGVRLEHHGWRAYDLGTEGKMREAQDIVIPSIVRSEELAVYIADLLHESATLKHPDVRRLM